ncbi:FAD-dependent oxidoreductase [Spongiibacter sp.]|uniref:FAD-dependent oxidoreductase n=1 Tax=Spongiibacter sp. TaxID=2024860 RepID=UPI003569054B
MNQPIVVVGAGPAGSALTLYLAQHDIPVILLEQAAQLPVDLRASTFHPPSLEMLDRLGVTEKMLAKGLVADKYQYRDRKTNEVAEFNMQLIADETKFPFRLQLEQYEMTRIVGDMLKDYPHVEVRFGHKVVGCREVDDGVIVEVENAGGRSEIHTPILVGSDGASSNVRKGAGIGFGGFTYDEKFLVVSTDFAFESVFDNLAWVNYVSDPDEWCVILRTEKLWRVLIPTEPGDDEATLLSDDFIQSRLRHLHDKGDSYAIHHRTLYNVHQRVSETYYKGRIVLAGDACHINNPLGGMGMNGGLHDAFNLAERLVNIVQGGADIASEFALYDRQRRQLAVDFVQKHTIENKKLMESSDPDIQKKRQAMLMETAADPVKAKAFLMERAMINCVRESLAVA